MDRKSSKLLTLFLFCIAYVASFSTLEAISKEKILVIGYGGEASTLFPMASDQAVLDRVSNASEPLVGLDPDAKAIPVLATNWEVVDGKKWRFHLRKGVKFHNGEEFTSEDVAFTIDLCLDPENKCPRRGMLRGYSCKIVDKYTIDIVHEKEIVNPILPLAWYSIKILPKNTVMEMGVDKFSRAPIGTGPFKIIEWKKGEHCILQAFDKYWGGKPKIDKVVFKTIPEIATRVVGFKTGDLDIIIDVPPLEVKSIEANPNLKIIKKTSLWDMHLQLRCDIPPFKDNINLRKAVAHAIDSESICREILGGFAIPVGGVTPPTSFGYNKNLKPYKFDPNLSKEYLQKAGYKGEEIQFMSSNGRYVMDVEVNTAIAGYLKAIGMNIKLDIVDWPTYAARWTSKKGFHMMVIGWCDNSGDGVENLFDIAHKDSPYHFLPGGGIKEVNEQIDIARTTNPPNVRREAIEKANQLLQDYYFLGISYAPIKVYGVRKGVRWSPRADETIMISPEDNVP